MHAENSDIQVEGGLPVNQCCHIVKWQYYDTVAGRASNHTIRATNMVYHPVS